MPLRYLAPKRPHNTASFWCPFTFWLQFHLNFEFRLTARVWLRQQLFDFFYVDDVDPPVSRLLLFCHRVGCSEGPPVRLAAPLTRLFSQLDF